MLATAISCGLDNQVKRKTDKDAEYAEVQMETELSTAKSHLAESYKEIQQQTKDSTSSVKISDFYSNVNSSVKYVDSLRDELNKLDNMDTKNVELIREVYLYDGVADSVFDKLKRSYDRAIDIALTDQRKVEFRKVQDTFSEETKKHIFALNSPLGVNMLLFGFEVDLIKNATQCLEDYGAKR